MFQSPRDREAPTDVQKRWNAAARERSRIQYFRGHLQKTRTLCETLPRHRTKDKGPVHLAGRRRGIAMKAGRDMDIQSVEHDPGSTEACARRRFVGPATLGLPASPFPDAKFWAGAGNELCRVSSQRGLPLIWSKHLWGGSSPSQRWFARATEASQQF